MTLVEKILLEVSETHTPGGIKFEGIFTPETWMKTWELQENSVKGMNTRLNVLEYKKLTPSAFNNGFCGWFAEAVEQLYPGKFKTLDSDDFKTELRKQGVNFRGGWTSHYFLTDGKKYYDAESPLGVDNMWELQYFQRMIKKIKPDKVNWQKIFGESYLREAKQVGVLYHYTNFGNIESIVKQNQLKPTTHSFMEKGKLHHIQGVSTTRDQMFHRTGKRTEDGIQGQSVRIALDGNKISNHYKILPFNYFHKSEDLNVARPKNTESEEFILSEEGLKNLKNYILHITFFPQEEENNREARRIKSILNTIKDAGIKVEMDDMWYQYIEDDAFFSEEEPVEFSDEEDDDSFFNYQEDPDDDDFIDDDDELNEDVKVLDYIKTKDPLKDTDKIRVYHGFNRMDQALAAIKYGLSGQMKAKRIYSYEWVNNPKGVFVSVDFFTVKREFTHSGIIIEFDTLVSNLEAPVWAGQDSYYVQGQYTKGFNSEEERTAEQLRKREKFRQNDPEPERYANNRISKSDRPEVAEQLFNNSEKQALFIGNLDPNNIKYVWFHSGLFYDRTTRGEWQRMTRKDFLKAYSAHVEKEYGDSGDLRDAKDRMFRPNEDFDLSKFKKILDTEGWDYDAFVKHYVPYDFEMLRFMYPKQIKQFRDLLNAK